MAAHQLGMNKNVRVWPLFLIGGGILTILAATQSIFTGTLHHPVLLTKLVNGGHCAVVFNKITGTRQDVSLWWWKH